MNAIDEDLTQGFLYDLLRTVSITRNFLARIGFKSLLTP